MYKKLLYFISFIVYFMGNTSLASTHNLTIPITGQTAPENTILTREELWDIFSLNFPFWKNGQRIVIVMYEMDNPVQKTFLREYFGINPYRYQELIDSKINSGRVPPPIIVSDEKQMIRQIKNKAGRIGFTRSYVLIGEVDGIQKIKITN